MGSKLPLAAQGLHRDAQIAALKGGRRSRVVVTWDVHIRGRLGRWYRDVEGSQERSCSRVAVVDAVLNTVNDKRFADVEVVDTNVIWARRVAVVILGRRISGVSAQGHALPLEEHSAQQAAVVDPRFHDGERLVRREKTSV